MPSPCPSGPLGAVCRVTIAPGEAVIHPISTATGSMLHDVAAAMASAATGLLKTLSSFWMNVDTPQLTGASSPVTAISSGTRWVTTAGAVVCILVAAARMAIRRRGEPASAMAFGLARLVVVSTVATFVVQLAGQAGDQWSAALMSAAHIGGNGWSGVISVTAISAAFASGDGMLLIIALLITIAALIQLLLMVLRIGLLIVLTGTLPLAAAASMSDWGETWWRKHLGWLVAWLVYKPAAAVLFASASVLTQGKQSLVEVSAGFMLLVLMVFTMPALLRLIVPATSALGAASGGALALGAAGAVATGAARIGGIDGVRSLLSGRGADGPSGNSGATGGDAVVNAAGAMIRSAGEGLPGSEGGPDRPPPGSATSSSERIFGDSPGSTGSGALGDTENIPPGADTGSSPPSTAGPDGTADDPPVFRPDITIRRW